MTVPTNIKARQAAETIFQLAVEESQQLDESAVLTFWCKLLLLIEGVLPEGVRTKPATEKLKMNDEESRRFDSFKMPFGKHAGTPIKDVPMDYLLWLDETDNGFPAMLKRYLASDRIQKEIGGE